MEQTWLVLLEATGEAPARPIEADTLRELMSAMGGGEIEGLHVPYRYALQLRLLSTSPAEALFTATARWAAASHGLGLDGWVLQRVELLTPAEFERDRLGAETPRLAAVAGAGDELLRSVFHDSLTGLPTLALFRDHSEGIVSGLAASGRRTALLVIDIDGLGAVNRELGYIYGDQVLVELAGRLAGLADSIWEVGRLAGDEFVLLVDANAGSVDIVAVQLMAAVRAPIDLRGEPIIMTVSIGVVAIDPGTDFDVLLRRAGIAMCATKESGGDGYRWWRPDLTADTARLDSLARGVPDRMAYISLLEHAALAANECASLEEASHLVLHEVLAHTGWRAGHLWLADQAGATLAPTGVWRLSGPEPLGNFQTLTDSRTLAAGEGLAGTVLESARASTAVLGGGGQGPYQQAGVDAGLVGAVAFPVFAGPDVVAVLEFFCRQPITADESLVDVMAAVGAQLGRVYERTQAAAALARSEARYRTLTDSLPALIWASGPDQRNTFSNRATREFAGRTMEELMGYGWVEMVHPADRALTLERFSDGKDRRVPVEHEYRSLRSDGEYRWLLDRGAPVFEDGEFTGYVGSCVDVTDRHEAQTRFRALVESAQIMIFVIDGEGKVIDELVSQSTLGYQPGAVPGRFPFFDIHPDDAATAARAVDEVVSRPGQGRSFTYRARHADGSWRTMRTVANNLLDHPVVHGIVVTAIDITEV